MVYDRATAPTPSKPPPPPVHPTPVRAAADPGYTRLHITPFDAELLSVVVPASARPDARNVSFHSLQTFPEKRYGFVDLPIEAAEKLRRKLNGAVLKGVKLSIEAARQAESEKNEKAKDNVDTMGKKDKNLTPEEQKLKDEERAARKEKKRVDKEKARAAAVEKKGPSSNTEHEEVVGVQLEPGRQVKRGWTEPESAVEASAKKTNWSKDKKDKKDGKEKKDKTSKKRAEKSEYTDKPECLFKTILPASKVATPIIERDSDGDEVDPRAAKRARKEAKKAREVVVHEFANWTKIPTFLKAGPAAASASSGPNLEYVEGKGWVDESSGDVVQPLQSTRPVAVKGVITKEMQLAKRAKLDRLAAERAKALKESDPAGDESETSDSGSDTSSSGESSDEEVEEASEKEDVAEDIAKDNGKEDSKDELVPSAEESPARPQSSASAKNLMIKIPPPPTFAAAAPPSTPGPKKEVHPLEALYKRAKPDGDAANKNKKTTSTASPAAEAEADQPFSFFGGLNNDDIEEEEDVDAMDVVTTEKNNENDDTDALQPPMTPFGRAEFEWRNVRSAAPTPDTAHPSRMTSNFKWPIPGGASDEEDDKDEEDDEKDDEVADKEKKEKAAGEGDFQSWFWDNRGDLNRSWKRRRKTAAKDKRYRENRARAERAI